MKEALESFARGLKLRAERYAKDGHFEAAAAVSEVSDDLLSAIALVADLQTIEDAAAAAEPDPAVGGL